MSQQTKKEVLARLRWPYATAGPEHKTKLLDQAVQLLGYHRKAAIRGLRPQPKPPRAAALILGRPRPYHPDSLLPILKPIWFAAFQPCGRRLAALLPEGLPAYEADHGRMDTDVRASLRRPAPARWIGYWPRCGCGCPSGRHPAGQFVASEHSHSLGMDRRRPPAGWNWTRWRCAAACWMTDISALCAGGVGQRQRWEFINHHVVAWTGQRPRPILFTRSRP